MSHSTNCRNRPIAFVDYLSYSTKCLSTNCRAPLLHQGLLEPEFSGDLVYNLKKIVGFNNF